MRSIIFALTCLLPFNALALNGKDQSLVGVESADESMQTLSAHQHSVWGLKIESILAASDGSAIVYMEGGSSNITNPANCSVGGSYALSKNHVGFDTLYALLLSAYVAKKEVRFQIAGSGCVHSRPTIRNVHSRH